MKSTFWRSFIVWAIIIGAALVVRNLPDRLIMARDVAGFPLPFYDSWRGFDGFALAGEVVVGVLVTLGLAALYAWSRSGFVAASRRDTPPPAAP